MKKTFTLIALIVASATVSFAQVTLICPNDTVITLTSCYDREVNFDFQVSSPCGISTFSGNYESGDEFPIGTTTVYTTQNDNCGGTATCSFNITLLRPPRTITISCPGDTTVTAQNCNGAVVNFEADAYSGASIDNIYYSPLEPGDVFPIGTTRIKALAVDYCNDRDSCYFDVTVNPPLPPVVTCPADITVTPTGPGCSALVTYIASASSPAGIASFSAYPPSGSIFSNGTTTVLVSATDICGSVSSCSFNVNVEAPFTVDAGPDVSSVFGYASTQTVNRTVNVIGASGPFTYEWTLNRPLKCNQVNSTGDELFTGGSCSNNLCPSSGSATLAAPSCTGSASISATMLADAEVCVTVTDAGGCSATDCFQISAIDGRCFTGKAGKNKTKICHKTGSLTNPWVTICIPKSATQNYLANHPDDYVGGCAGRMEEVTADDNGNLMFYPNPFNSTGIVHFYVHEEGQALLEVYSCTGVKVATLFAGNVEAEEEKKIEFDASELADGIYICKLTAGNEVYYVKSVLSR